MASWARVAVVLASDQHRLPSPTFGLSRHVRDGAHGSTWRSACQPQSGRFSSRFARIRAVSSLCAYAKLLGDRTVAQTLRFTIKTVTPTYLGSAQPRQVDLHTPIRPPAVRGALRAWFRAAAAAVLWPVDQTERAKLDMIAALRDVETKVFGSTDHSSPFVVLPIALDPKRIKQQPIPDPARSPGVRYLGYGIFDNATQYVGVIEEDSTFDLVLGLRRKFVELEPLLVATVWLWTHMGGLGARTRRGFGSLELLEAPLTIFPEAERPILKPKSVQALIDDSLIRGLDGVVTIFAKYLPALTNHPVFADNAYPHVSLRTIDGIRFLKVMSLNAQNGTDALERAGQIFRSYRSTLERRKLGLPPLPDYFSVKQSLERQSPPHDVMRTAFGLPLSFYFRSLGGARTTFTPLMQRKTDPRDPRARSNEPGRLPSPLHFRVHRVHDGQTPRPVVTLLNLAQGEHTDVLLGCKIMQSKEQRIVQTNPTTNIIDDAVQWMCDHAQRVYGGPFRGKP